MLNPILKSVLASRIIMYGLIVEDEKEKKKKREAGREERLPSCSAGARALLG